MFNRIYRLEIQSVMLIFSTPVVNYSAPLPSLQFTSPPLPCVKKYSSIHYKQCVTGGGRGWDYVESIYSNTQCICPDSEPIKLLYRLKQNLGGERASDTCCYVL
jgi:hypothetical protein